MDDLFGLDLLSVGQSAVICKAEHSGGMRRRLFDMGFTQGTCVRCVGVSPQGDMRAYSVRGSVVALRLCDARLIKVCGIGGGADGFR